ncbi:MAG: peptidoglycan DD-metalloendopeptidase family protein [Flavobacteriaceae bacterium]|jgi:septal ring factor EnvC (AmiA/AmiB activator)|nr:peptidoglycan DD-metalloendopeptidase family protein [Flavobacteriaceae bacterium]
MKRTIISITFSLLAITSWGQKKETQEELERKKQQILIEIKTVKDLLQKERQKERNYMREIDEQNRKINLNQELLKNVQKQIINTNSNITRAQAEATALAAELEKLKQDYAATIVKTYKTRSSQSKMMFILSSDSFLQAYKRMQYLKQYADFRKMQSEEVKKKADELSESLKRLEVQKNTQRTLYNEQQENEKVLQKDLADQKVLVEEAKKDQKKYNEQIAKKQKETKAIDQKIKQLIREAIEEANRKAREEAARKAKEEAARKAKENAGKGSKTTTTKTTKTTTTKATNTKVSDATFELTPEGQVVANNFKANRGSLPWPVSKGYISLGYGDQPHPVQTHLTIHNSGVEITTEAGASARSVFQGEVLQVQVLPGGSKAVLIQHGDYITVYQNLSSVSVSKGDKVSHKQTIGTIGQNSSGKTVLKFLLSHNSDINNPQSWLSKNN